ncbi:MAG TPA: hypothetical protein VIJ28_03940 [Chloroflexota bacterium]
MARTRGERILYRHLEERSHPWRRQLWLRGRNMTVGQLVATMRANHLAPEQAAIDLDLRGAPDNQHFAYARTRAGRGNQKPS